jgi:electron transport complex protein RnfE
MSGEQKLKKEIFFNGIIHENPTFRLVLGMCPTLAVTTAVSNGLGMGVATTFVLVSSNSVISLLKGFIPDKVRIPSYIVVIAGFVTIVQLLMQAYVPALYESLGIFIPLIVVNCIILARAEAFASKAAPLDSVIDGLGMGVGFTLALILLSSVREILGYGTWFGLPVLDPAYPGILMLTMPAGGFVTLGILMGLQQLISRGVRRAKRRDGKKVQA